jgi:hypothetical protein
MNWYNILFWLYIVGCAMVLLVVLGRNRKGKNYVIPFLPGMFLVICSWFLIGYIIYEGWRKAFATRGYKGLYKPNEHGGSIRLNAAEVEIQAGGKCIYVHAPNGTTLLRIQTSGTVRMQPAEDSAPTSYGEVHTDMDIMVYIDKKTEDEILRDSSL